MDLDHYNPLVRRDIKLDIIIPEQMLQIFQMFIHWIFEQNKLEIKTIELAAILSKLFFSKNQIHSEKADLLGIASLMIAVKFNECQTKIQMNIQDCVDQCQFKYSSGDNGYGNNMMQILLQQLIILMVKTYKLTQYCLQLLILNFYSFKNMNCLRQLEIFIHKIHQTYLKIQKIYLNQIVLDNLQNQYQNLTFDYKKMKKSLLKQKRK
ncbi:unnamed protein product [Paramecium octaurelia]|uniref:Cyclin N-terminal domain-containing protein n=1 Tax=Paramecium octaurelia TaxID=43137 RepID=A0A8S1TH29_PAROT|nr:unnamed protein product [Paramecium octaurelia]